MLKNIIVSIVIQNIEVGGAGRKRAPVPTRGGKCANSVTREALGQQKQNKRNLEPKQYGIIKGDEENNSSPNELNVN